MKLIERRTHTHSKSFLCIFCGLYLCHGTDTIIKRSISDEGLSGTSGLASNPTNREIDSSSGASDHQDFFFDFFSIFFLKKT
jgi:hypothetical protein